MAKFFKNLEKIGKKCFDSVKVGINNEKKTNKFA